MKTILFFSWTHLWSMRKGAGAPSYYHTITHYIDSPEWDVHLFTADETNMELNIARDGRIHLFRAPEFVERGLSARKVSLIFKHIKHYLYTRWAIKEAEKIIGKCGFCYLYGYEIWGIKPAHKLSLKYHYPFIARYQGTAICSERDTWKNKLRRYPHYEALSTPADLIIMTDDGTFGDQVLKRLKNNSNCLFIRNGLDLYAKYKKIIRSTDTSLIKKELGIDEGEWVIMMSSRLTSWKRVDRGIVAMGGVLEKMRHVKLIIAGDGDEKEHLENLAVNMGISSHIIFLGSVLQKELYKYMLASDVFMSLYDIGNLGNPTFEAMLMRRPVIALNNGATCTVIHHNENGILLDLERLNQLPEVIIDLLENQKKREKIAAGAFEYAVKNFYTWEERMSREEKEIIKLSYRME